VDVKIFRTFLSSIFVQMDTSIFSFASSYQLIHGEGAFATMTQQASKKESCAAASVYKRMETLDGFSPKEKMPCDESKSHVRLQRICSVTTDDVLTTQDAFLIIQQGVVAEQQKQYKEAIQRFILAAEILDKSVTIASNSPRIQELLRGKSMEVFQWAENLLAYLELPTETRLMTPCPVRRSSGVDISTPMEAEPAVQVAVDELTNMHYTPVTTKNPIDFTQDGYRLQCLLRGRCARLLIVVTMYNEDEFEIESTLRKIANNVAYLQAHELPGYEGEQAWQNILVCVVSDGRTKANKGALKRLSEMGLFDEDTMTIFSKGLDTQMHLFEKTVVMKRANDTIVRKRSKLPPLQVVFALKEHNAGKLNSHLWFFKAFCEQVNPKYSVLLDVGTMPTKAAFYKLLATMEVNRQVGGVCGEIAVSRPLPNLWSLVIATQHYEYKISNILDKATESCFGFISVLPGAFSAYRYKAIQGAPLDAYFKSLTTSMQELGPFQGNMYLAEDRILCFELLAREGANWTMTYVKDAIARTDVPTTLVDLIVQRRRWLNGSFFAMLYTLFNWGRIYSESNHGLLRVRQCFDT
jgi:chitin synthase